MGQVAIIGWGSLVWDLDDLAPHVSGSWRMEEGPMLPLEFTRISPKRKNGLAVCIDETFGTPCPTHIIASARADCTEAILDLAKRERTEPQNIGALCRRTGIRKAVSARIMGTIDAWAKSKGWSCAVWTDIGSNFEAELGEPFSVPRGLAYLGSLTGESRREAIRYIAQAPSATDTPLRRALAEEPWWREEASRFNP
ncbi:MAG: hypothetical protein AAFR17_16040 [Pseudomonadota bacterium]